jgi:hypothetical protein
MGEKVALSLLVGKPDRKRQLTRPKSRLVDNIKMNLAEMIWDDVDWISLAQGKNNWRSLVSAVMNLRVP